MNKFCKCEQTAGYEPCTRPPKITLRTVALPANLGDDTEGAPYAPRLGAYYNTVVQYLANKATYIYDSNGIYTLVEPGNYDQLVAKVDGLAETLTALEQKEQEDVDNLQTNINQLANKEAEDVENLQTNINQEVENREAAVTAEATAREEADTAINQRITDIQNSPDVRFIEPTYAALEALDKTGVGDKDYARVLQDENHDGASTYYQFDLANQTWNYVGEVGEYYTKGQVDEKVNALNTAIEAVDTTKLNELADIKTIGANLTLSEEGELSAIGGGNGGGAPSFYEFGGYVQYDSFTDIQLPAMSTDNATDGLIFEFPAGKVFSTSSIDAITKITIQTTAGVSPVIFEGEIPLTPISGTDNYTHSSITTFCSFNYQQFWSNTAISSITLTLHHTDGTESTNEYEQNKILFIGKPKVSLQLPS